MLWLDESQSNSKTRLPSTQFTALKQLLAVDRALPGPFHTFIYY